MGGEVVPVGPFTGGLNIREDARIIADGQLAECINFDIGRAGELTTRTGLKAIAYNNGNPAGSVPVRILGSLATTSGSRLFLRTVEATPRIFYSDNPEPPDLSTVWTAATTTTAKEVGAVVQGVDAVNTTTPYAWFIPRGSSATGFRQVLTGTTESAVASMPRGSGGFIFKSRLFIWGPLTLGGTGTYRVYYSAAGDFTSWPANNFFDVGPGDGETVTALIGAGDTLLIFKTGSTWALLFDTDPYLGSLRKVNNEIGANSPTAVASFQNEIYIVSRLGIYRVVNLLFQDVGKSLGLDKTRGAVDFTLYNDSVSVIGSKIIFALATGVESAPFKYYVYFTEIDAWSQYTFGSLYPERFQKYLDYKIPDHVFATQLNSPVLYHMHPYGTEAVDFGDSPNNITAFSMRTKKFSYSGATDYKRLFWWAMEAVAGAANTAFSMYCIADDVRTSEVQPRAVGTLRGIVKAFTTNRFRTVQYVITSSAVQARLIFFSGQANVAGKTKVASHVVSSA